MIVWLVTIGEPLPLDGAGARLFRCGILARRLAARGHRVLWWTSSFDHFNRRQRVAQHEFVPVEKNLEIAMIRGTGYRRNVSLARIRDHRVLASEFRRLARAQPRPDVIAASFPPIELCLEVGRYGAEQGVPVALDIRDLWPDLFADILPAPLRPLGRLALAPLSLDARRALRLSTSIVGLTDAFVDWGLRKAGRARRPLDRVFAMGYEPRTLQDGERARCAETFRAMGITPDRAILCFFGTMGRQFDLETVIRAARIVGRARPDVQFVLCGAGEQADALKRSARDCPNVVFPGWIDAAHIWYLMEISKAGLAPYRLTPNFQLNLPNKPIEYMAAGLPVLSSLDGELGRLIGEHECGAVYRPGSATSLAEKTLALLADPDAQRRVSENARALFVERFRADQVYGEYASFLEGLAERGARSR